MRRLNMRGPSRPFGMTDEAWIFVILSLIFAGIHFELVATTASCRYMSRLLA